MRKTLIVAALLFATPAYAVGTAFLDHSYVVGQSRICVYKFLGSEYHITVRSYESCPRSIPV